jgi:hypothetical protein
MRNVAGRSRVGAFAEAVTGRSVAGILAFLLSGESAYYRCVEGRRRRRFPEGKHYDPARVRAPASPNSRIQRAMLDASQPPILREYSHLKYRYGLILYAQCT